MKTINVITTVGTSLFENYRQTFLNEENNINDAKEQLLNIEAKKLNLENQYVTKLIGDEEDYGIQEEFFKGYVTKKEKKWIKINDKTQLNTQASAEITSILKIYEKQKDENIKLNVYLLASDTVLSVLAAVLIKEWFEQAEVKNQYKNIEVIFNNNVKSPNADYIEKLRTDLKKDEIYEGFNHLIEKIIELSKKNKENTIVNITGGYKGFIPVLTIIAQLEGLKLNYIYEDSDNLIEIINMPIEFDFSFVEDNYLAFENIKPSKSINNLPTKELFLELLNNSNDFNILSTNKIVEIREGRVKLTLFGKLLFNKYEELYNKNELARQKLLGEVIEYKLYEYFLKKEEKAKVIKGKNLGKENFDIDVYIERENEIEAIEVKPGGNIPIDKKRGNNSIEYRLTKGSFKYIVDNIEKEKYIFHLIAYFHQDIHDVVKDKIQNLFQNQDFSNKNVVLKLSLFRVPINYKRNVNWKVNENMIEEII